MPGENLDYFIHGCPQRMDHDARKTVKVSFSQLKLHQLTILLCRAIFSTGATATSALEPAIFGHFKGQKILKKNILSWFLPKNER